jgi:hypothetical protein
MSFNSNFQTADGLYSVYIPTIHSNYTQEEISERFSYHNIGEVVRVDFAPFQNETITSQASSSQFRRAFVHFKLFGRSLQVFDKIESEGSYRFYIDVENNRNTYWILLKNNAPVPKTYQNIDQLAHNAKLMEEKMMLMEEQMDKREAEIEEKMAQMNKREAEIEEQLAVLKQKFTAMVEFSMRTTQVIEVQTKNIEMFSKFSERLEQAVLGYAKKEN